MSKQNLLLQIAVIILLMVLFLVNLLGCDESSSSSTSNQQPPVWNPTVDPAQFVTGIDHPFFPVTPGRVLVYAGDSDGVRDSVEERSTFDTRQVMGIECMVVEFKAWEDEELVEIAYDWYAQDMDGNVWYFGEDVENYDDGELVDNDGSWEARVDGAVPGFIMKASPVVGESFYSEYYEGEAEDQVMVVSLTSSVSIDYGEFTNCIETEDWTDLEPDVVEHKYYSEGIGMVYEEVTRGGAGAVALVEIREP